MVPSTHPGREVLQVSGPDSETFLQRLLTNSVLDLAEEAPRYAGLLTPQGKLIADMFVHRLDHDFMLEVATGLFERVANLLDLYRLGADVVIAARPDLGVRIDADDASADPRDPALPGRSIGLRSESREATPDERDTYHRKRVRACAAESGVDFEENEVFPFEINMDTMSGIDFGKGCFIGQEVVSRMKRRGTIRKRTLTLRLDGPAPASGAEVTADGRAVGIVTSVAGRHVLARLRIDRLPDGARSALLADGKPATCDVGGVLAETVFGSPHR